MTTSQPAPQPTPQERYATALRELPAKRRKFVTEFLRDLNATQAAIRAGYAPISAASQASEIRRIPKVAEAIALGIELQAMPESEILARLSAQARGDMSDFLRVDEEEIVLQTTIAALTSEEEARAAEAPLRVLGELGADGRAVRVSTATITRSVARLDLVEAGRRGKLGLIKKYTLDPDTGKVALELYSAKDALELLGKHRKLWGDDGAGGILKYLDLSKLAPDQLERLSAGEDPYAVLLGK